MREQLGSSTALTELRDALADPANEVGERFDDGRRFVRRMQTTGLTGDERRRLVEDAVARPDAAIGEQPELCRDAAANITGTNIAMDGGWTAE